MLDMSWQKEGGCPKGSVPIVRHVLTDHRIIRKNMSFADPANSTNGHQPDGYSTGCYDLKCPGWVLTSNQYSPGMSLQPSTYGGQQSELAMDIEKIPLGIPMRSHKISFWDQLLHQNVTTISLFRITLSFISSMVARDAVNQN
ncbi:hypothetical protein Ancab_029672 [Ancistrocladus abbreviatus]